jgi:DNA polymerase-4
VQTPADSAVAIAASYAAKAFGIKTGSLVRDARRLCPDVIPVQAIIASTPTIMSRS